MPVNPLAHQPFTPPRRSVLYLIALLFIAGCGSAEETIDGGKAGGNSSDSGGGGGTVSGGTDAGGGSNGGASGGAGGTIGGSGSSAGADGGMGGTGGMAGAGNGGSSSAPDLLDDLLSDLPAFDCGQENPCVIGGSCEGDTNPCSGDRSISSASELDSIRDCTSLQGDLDISASDLESLGPLSLRTVGGSLTIHGNDALVSLEGLESLASVGSFLVIGSYGADGGNPKLTDLRGLEGLRFVGGLFSINHADNLTSLVGLNFEGSSPNLDLSSNPKLSDLSALSSLECGSLNLSQNASLTDLSGLENLKQIYSLALYDNPLLSDISALQGLTSLTGNLTVYASPLLDSLDVFSNLTTVGRLFLGGLPEIHDFGDFQKLTKIGGDLVVQQGESEMSFNGLSKVQVIGRDLEIDGGMLGSFEGLGSVQAIGGEVKVDESVPIDDFSGLTSMRSLGILATENLTLDLAGLEKVEFIGALSFDGDAFLDVPSQLPSAPAVGTLEIRQTSLTDLSPFSDLLVMDGLRVAHNASLSSLTGLKHDGDFEGPGSPGMHFDGGFEGSVELTDNPLLVDISALSGLIRIGGTLQIGSSGLSQLVGLEDVQSVGDYPFVISNNPSLENLDGLIGLTSAVGPIDISDNRQLASVAGLSNLVEIVPLPGGDGSTTLSIQRNPVLPTCSIEAIVDGLNNTDNLNVFADGNDTSATCP